MNIKSAAFALMALVTLVTAPAFAQQAKVVDDEADLPAAPAGNPDVEKQFNGQYPTMDRQAPVPLGATQKAWDKAGPSAGIFKVKWQQETTTKIALRSAMTTTIRLPLWETIDRVILGDTTIYHVKQLDDQTVTLWISNPGSDTSLTILGQSHNIYSFYLRSSDVNAGFISDLLVLIDAQQPDGYSPDSDVESSGGNGPVSILGPEGHGPSLHLASYRDDKKKKPEWLKDVPFDPARIRRDLALFGDQELAPDDVFRDDQFTYLCYGERWNDGDFMVATPAVVTDGTDRPVNFRVKSGCMIIESTGQLSLKHGNEVLCVKPDPDRVAPRISAAAVRVRALKPAAPARKGQPAAKTNVPSSSAPSAGPITTQPLPPASGASTAPADQTPANTDKRSGK
ncbi:MAG TPA: TrbG/VirB9 family P-type conjugative transfer protein [Terriglobia bacterium]|nr:TrbG/VirB9 family P-type conjugative transfer protein [Terriglobia bacterium]